MVIIELETIKLCLTKDIFQIETNNLISSFQKKSFFRLLRNQLIIALKRCARRLIV